jgi:hypothetical protein
MDECKPLPAAMRHLREHSAFRGVQPLEHQGLTLVHFSAQLEPCLTHTKHPTHPKHPLTPP